MRIYDQPETIIAKLTDSHAAMMVHPPDTPEIAMRWYVKTWVPFKELRTPPKHARKDWRKNAREDFHFKCAVLLVTMIFGRQKVSQKRAVEIWIDLRDEHPGTKKTRGPDTIYDVWKDRNFHGRNAWDAGGKCWADAPYATRADCLALLADMLRADEERLAARAATAHAAITGGQK